MLVRSAINRIIPWEKNLNKRQDRLIFQIHLDNAILSEDAISAIINPSLIPFAPHSITLGKREIKYDTWLKDTALIEEALKANNSISINSQGKNNLPEYLTVAKNVKFNMISISYCLDFAQYSNAFFDTVIYLAGYKALRQAVVYSGGYLSLISREKPEEYKYKGGLHYYQNDYGDKYVDISSRPGRRAWLPRGNFFIGASHFWFGPNFFEAVPKEKILSFSLALVNEEIAPDVVFVHLYELPQNGLQKDALQVQKAFRSHLEIDRLAV